VVVFGTDEQKRRWLPPLIRGEQKACFAVTEPDAGLNTTRLKTFARNLVIRGCGYGMMFGLRHFAGPIAERMSNAGMLCASAVLASLGLLALARADSPASAIGAATIWGLGVCFMWPTMLASVSERFPRGGELFIGLMGFAGALSIHFVLPALGAVFDRAKLEIAGGAAAFASLAGGELETVLRAAAATSFRTLAVLPALLIAVFGAIALFERRRRQP